MMRSIELEEGLRIRFPGQDEPFAAGVEIGVLAMLMHLKTSEFVREIGTDNVEQARVVARRLGYHLADLELVTADKIRITFRARTLAPKLRLISSAG